MDEHGLHECIHCKGTGQVPDRMTHAQVEWQIQDIRLKGNTLSVMTFVNFILGAGTWIALILHMLYSK